MAEQDPIYSKAIAHLASLIEDARQRGDRETSSAALATAGVDARPSVRMVDVRISASGLLIFANADSGKGQQMQKNPRAAVCFHWPVLQYQAIVEGLVTLLSEADSDAQWRSVPRDYTLGHWASDQTKAQDHPTALRQNMREYQQQFEWERVPRAPSWRAFEIGPERIEFWPTGWQRLLARQRYLKTPDGSWAVSSENP